MKRTWLLLWLLSSLLLPAQNAFRSPASLAGLNVVFAEAGGGGGGYADISGAEIETNGWILRLYINDLGTNGSINNGFDSNNIPTSPKLTVSLTSMGFSTNAEPITRPRQVFGKRQVRMPYPAQDINDIVKYGTSCVVRVALSDFVYSKDSNLTLTVLEGAYATTNVSTTNCNAASDVTVTNGSVQPYPRAIANWTWPGFQWETNSDMRVHAVGFSGIASNWGQPLACMKFRVHDESGATQYLTITEMSTNSGISGDQMPFGEYHADFTLASFTALDRLRCDFAAYPWYGDSGAVCDTATLGLAAPKPASITNLCDPAMAYSDAIAVVDSGGNDSTGGITNVAPASVDSAWYFLTIAGAAKAITNYNYTNFGHKDIGGGAIYVKSTITNYPGAENQVYQVADAWCKVANYPGDSVTIKATSGGDDRRMPVMFSGIDWEIPAGQIPFYNAWKVWMDGCKLNSATTVMFGNVTNVYLSHCAVSNFTQGIVPVAGYTGTSFPLVRGCDLTGFDGLWMYWTAIGNVINDTNSSTVSVDFHNAQTSVSPDYQILYNNRFTGLKRNGTIFGAGDDASIPSGIAIVQNLFECTSVDEQYFFITDNSFQYTNGIFWHNTFVGARFGIGYNDSGSAPAFRYACSFRNNIREVTGLKTDTHPDPGEDGARIGNWPIMYGVNWAGDISSESTIQSAAGGYPPESAGMVSYYPFDLTGRTNAIDFLQFTERRAYDGNGAVEVIGAGDYTLQATSPALLLTNNFVLPFDIMGTSRDANDPPGAYAY